MTLNHNCGCFSGVGSGIAGNTDIYATSGVYTPKIEIYTQLIITYFSSGLFFYLKFIKINYLIR